MLYKNARPYVPMTREDVVKIWEAGRRVKALDSLIERSLKSNLNTTALLAQREVEGIRREIYQEFDIRL